MDTLRYLLRKIEDAPFLESPFRHIEILDFFSQQHFDMITTAPEIALAPQPSDGALFDALFEHGYKIINFPGCITDKNTYLKWHKAKRLDQTVSTACEGYGVTLRLMAPKSRIVTELFEFIGSAEFQRTLAAKFELKQSDVFYDAGIQKYLDGYEISPHPDIRRKAATFMVNINPGTATDHREHHTHYMRFREPYRYVHSYWDGRANEDRCWVPWEWCESDKQQRANNSIVLFSPSNTSLHAVKAQYDHLASQRTQLYGNLWYHQVPVGPGPQWEDFRITARSAPGQTVTFSNRIKELVPSNVKAMIRSAMLRRPDRNVVADRFAKK